jgi:UDP-glucose 4-epimerase
MLKADSIKKNMPILSENFTQKICIVTGGAGFIGSELVRQLSAAGAQVHVIDNLVNGKRENIAELPNVTLHELDIRNPAVRDLLPGAAVVFHLACLGVRHSIHAPHENHSVNATATLQLLDWARAAGVGRFVYVSSSEVYGTAQFVPMPESHPTYPLTVYGASKLAGECYTRAFYHTYGYPTVVVRPFNAYGPRCHHEGDSGEVIPKFILRSLAGLPLVVFGDGTQTRDFTFVSDTARGILLAGSTQAAVGRTINLGNGQEIQIADLAHLVADITAQPVSVMHIEPRPGDVLRLYADSTLASELLGFEPQVSLRSGLQQLLAWYQNSGHSVTTLLQQEVVRNWEKAGHG